MKTPNRISLTSEEVKRIINNISINAHLDDEHLKKVSRPFFDISFSDFRQFILIKGKDQLLKRGLRNEFIIDSENEHLISNLYYYLTGNDKFTGDLFKGILLIGNFGTGKTIIMQAFLYLYDMLIKNNPYTSQYHQSIIVLCNQDLEEIIRERKLKSISNKIILIDDIGRETAELNNYGTKLRPMVQLLEMRYNKRALTFGTSNYKLDSFKTMYTEYISTRMLEMFNFIELTGKSRRK